MEPDPSALRRPEPPPPPWRARIGGLVSEAVGRASGQLRFVGAGRIATGLLAAGGAVVVGWWLVAVPPAPVEESLPRASTSVEPVDPSPGTPSAALPAVPATSLPARVVVHVAGAVAAPGVYSLPAGARVVDAITLAGGTTSDADPAALNLAATLVDGQKVTVPRPGEAVPAETGPLAASPPSGPLSLSTATTEQLDTLPGIGPVLAEAILRWRSEHGGFRTVDDLTDVPGIGPALLERLRDLVTT